MTVVLVDGPDILIEKNEVINMQVNKSRLANNTMSISVNKKITFGQLIDNAVKNIGPSIYLYDHINNNCQKFIKDILNSSGLLNPEAKNFIMQDAESILKTSPEYINTFARFATETASKINRLVEGEGKRKRKTKSIIKKIKYKPKL